MMRVELNGITYDIAFEHGIYFARASSGESPIGLTVEELSQGLANTTGLKKEDINEYLISLDI